MYQALYSLLHRKDEEGKTRRNNFPTGIYDGMNKSSWVGCNLSYYGTLSIVTFQKTKTETLRVLSKRKPYGKYFVINLSDFDSDYKLRTFLTGNKVPLDDAIRMVQEFNQECFI
jgi:hypothetical protein